MFGLCKNPKRGGRSRLYSDEEAILPIDAVVYEKAHDIQAEIENQMGPSLKGELQQSLQDTLVDLRKEYPEEDNPSIVRQRANTELSEYAHTYSHAARGDWPVEDDMEPTVANPSLVLDHSKLVNSIYEAQGLDFAATQGKAQAFLRKVGLRPHDLGSRNTSVEGEMLLNQCFYLSMAHAYLGSAGELLRPGFARRLKLAIESSVLETHPEWAADLKASNSGEGYAMVFSDFLPAAMHAKVALGDANLLASFVVCIIDSVTASVEVYVGPGYAQLESRVQQVRNLILLWYVPGHYECLVCDDEAGSKVQMTYDEFKTVLTNQGVVYIETFE